MKKISCIGFITFILCTGQKFIVLIHWFTM